MEPFSPNSDCCNCKAVFKTQNVLSRDHVFLIPLRNY